MPDSPSLDRDFDRFCTERNSTHLIPLFDAMSPEILRVARGSGLDHAGAQDVLQETFVGLMESTERFESGRRIVPWVRGIATRQIRAEWRRRARLRTLLLTVAAEVKEEAEPDYASLNSSETLAQVTVFIETLKETQRVVVAAALLEGLRRAEIAARLGLQPGTVSVRLHRGLEELRKKLIRHETMAAAHIA